MGKEGLVRRRDLLGIASLVAPCYNLRRVQDNSLNTVYSNAPRILPFFKTRNAACEIVNNGCV
ncbi:MAG: hypothetical protein MUF71_07665 [Candidatus Kapabacteria bacterium]|jgi:hypothetical protein|nr:hypothetical protein [Candidatus Kapabacteria bacterium]